MEIRISSRDIAKKINRRNSAVKLSIHNNKESLLRLGELLEKEYKSINNTGTYLTLNRVQSIYMAGVTHSPMSEAFLDAALAIQVKECLCPKKESIITSDKVEGTLSPEEHVTLLKPIEELVPVIKVTLVKPKRHSRWRKFFMSVKSYELWQDM